jgi:hypothetical protein
MTRYLQMQNFRCEALEIFGDSLRAQRDCFNDERALFVAKLSFIRANHA